ncbi:MAG: hypothetical protein RHS_4299 [Robinsoniella sp. RHS]|nr:MAG: hypothetical protein RHS_4299 [Robinsoniella sp. RHS]
MWGRAAKRQQMGMKHICGTVVCSAGVFFLFSEQNSASYE